MELLRIIRSQWLWFATNTMGWAIAMASAMVVSIFAISELSYDRFHTKADQIYRLTLESSFGSTSMHPARVVGNWPMDLLKEYPALEKIARLVPFRKSVVKIEENKFYLSQAFSTDSSFFDVFDTEILTGQKSSFLTQPNKVLLSRSIAQKYFGSIDVVGKTVSILNQQLSEPLLYTVEGVYEDFPKNSHFHPDLLASFTEIDYQTTWAYTYYLISQGVNVDTLRHTIHQKWKEQSSSDRPQPEMHLQKISDIHLYSSKTREIESNGNIRSLVMLGSAAFIILIIALVNFINLCRVKFIYDTKRITIKMVNGAKRIDIIIDSLFETLALAIVSVIIALFIAGKLSPLLNISIFSRDYQPVAVFVCLVFIVLIAVVGISPIITSKISASIIKVPRSTKTYSIPLLLQFTLSIIAISCTIILGKQISFLNDKHPESRSANTIVMADNPWEAVQRFELFKEELLKISEIESVSGAMEEPGGDILDAVPFEMEGLEMEKTNTINIFTTDSNFFKLMGIHPLAGSVDLGYTPTKQWESSAMELSILKNNNINTGEKVKNLEEQVGNYREKYIINQSALKLLGISNPNEAIGKRFRLNFHLPYLFPEGEIVAVVPDFYYTNLHSSEKPLAIVARKLFMHCFIVRVNSAQFENGIKSIERVWNEINPDYPFQYRLISDSYQMAYSNEYSQIQMITIFTLISLFLSSLGIFALSSFNMQRRVKEIGIRKVNGAKIWQVMLMLNTDFVKWVAIAFVIATPIAYYAMDKWLQNFAYRTPLSWWVFALAGLLALVIALLTVSWQSWWAARRNPVEALRYE
jgi:putative ABC transport system permease protein